MDNLIQILEAAAQVITAFATFLAAGYAAYHSVQNGKVLNQQNNVLDDQTSKINHLMSRAAPPPPSNRFDVVGRG